MIFFFFFFQAEDGIRDLTVTGVQTCALPIFRLLAPRRSRNCCSSSHLRRTTTSRRISAIWAAGPPNAMQPSLRKRSATSPADRLEFDADIFDTATERSSDWKTRLVRVEHRSSREVPANLQESCIDIKGPSAYDAVRFTRSCTAGSTGDDHRSPTTKANLR